MGSRGVPRVLDIAGLANSSATVTVNSQSTQREGEHWFKQLALSSNAAQWTAGAPRKRIDYVYDDRGGRTLKSVYTWNTSTSAFNTTPATKIGFLYHDWNLLQEVDLSGSAPATLRSYYWGLDLSGTLQGAGGVGGLLAADLNAASYSTAFYATDANGNVSDLAWAQGGFAAHYEYDAFGNAFPENTGWINLASLTPFRFSTKYTETDATAGGNETGLLYYGYRFYSPSAGRWPNRDPIAERGGKNLYAFLMNAALTQVDAHGLEAQATEEDKAEEELKLLSITPIIFPTPPTPPEPPPDTSGRRGVTYECVALGSYTDPTGSYCDYLCVSIKPAGVYHHYKTGWVEGKPPSVPCRNVDHACPSYTTK